MPRPEVPWTGSQQIFGKKMRGKCKERVEQKVQEESLWGLGRALDLCLRRTKSSRDTLRGDWVENREAAQVVTERGDGTSQRLCDLPGSGTRQTGMGKSKRQGLRAPRLLCVHLTPIVRYHEGRSFIRLGV